MTIITSDSTPPESDSIPAAAPRVSMAKSAFSTTSEAAEGTFKNKAANITTTFARPSFIPGGKPITGATVLSSIDSTIAAANSIPVRTVSLVFSFVLIVF